jgi:glycerophosphoryl diester phosphodiesterase
MRRVRTEVAFIRTARALGRHITACSASLLSVACFAQPITIPRTLDGAPPLIIGHRGLPGLYPEEVIAGYEAAIAAGTDALELDLQSSSDGVLFACHNVYLSDTTDVAKHPEFASRRTTRMVDGVATGPDWYISDFTAAELKTLRVRQPIAIRSKE